MQTRRRSLALQRKDLFGGCGSRQNFGARLIVGDFFIRCIDGAQSIKGVPRYQSLTRRDAFHQGKRQDKQQGVGRTRLQLADILCCYNASIDIDCRLRLTGECRLVACSLEAGYRREHQYLTMDVLWVFFEHRFFAICSLSLSIP